MRCPDALDRTDVDHPRIGARRPCCFEQTEQPLAQEEHRFDIQVHHLVPAVFGELSKSRAPARAGIVDQNIETLFPLVKLGGGGLSRDDRIGSSEDNEGGWPTAS